MNACAICGQPVTRVYLDVVSLLLSDENGQTIGEVGITWEGASVAHAGCAADRTHERARDEPLEHD